MKFADFLTQYFPGGKHLGGDKYADRCPYHDDHHASLHISKGDTVEIVMNCKVGCTNAQICGALGLSVSDLYDNEGKKLPASSGLSQRYEIRTPAGALVVTKTRTDYPGTDKRKKIGWENLAGGNNLGGLKMEDLPLYRSEFIKDFAADRWVDLHEGEKKTKEIAALGSQALGIGTGASGCPSVDVLRSLQNCKVRLWPDNDKTNAGRMMMQRVAAVLRAEKISPRVIILDTSGLPLKGDCVQWIEAEQKAGVSRGQLRMWLEDGEKDALPGLPVWNEKEPLITAAASAPSTAAAEPTKPKPSPKPADVKEEDSGPASRLPLINVTGQQLRETVAHGWAAIHKASAEQPIMFRRALRLVTVEQEGQSAPVVGEIKEAKMRLQLSEVANWFELKGSGEAEKLAAISPPRDVVQSLLAKHDPKIPALDLVSNAPLFSPSGEVCTQPGYNTAGRLWLTKAAEVGLQLIEPTKENALKAVDFLFNDFLVDFKFAQPCDRANCLAALLLPAVRAMISGPTPLHDVNSPVQRVGKSLLVSVITTVYLGSPVVAQGLPLKEDEVEKTLLAELMMSRAFIFFDNGDSKDRRVVDSSALERALTGIEYAGRILGKSKMSPDIPVRAVWFITGVNLEFKKGLMGRRVRIRLDPKLENPSARTGFVHPNIIQWTKINRAVILSAIFTIVRYFLSIAEQDRPVARTLGSYEEWAQLIGGILLSVEVPGFLDHFDDPAELAVEGEADEWEEFILAWWKEFEDYPQPIAKLNDLAAAKGHLEAIRGDKTKPSQVIKLGFALKKRRDNIFGAYCLTYSQNKHNKAAEYSLKKLSDLSTGDAEEPAITSALPSVDLPF